MANFATRRLSQMSGDSEAVTVRRGHRVTVSGTESTQIFRIVQLKKVALTN